MAAMALGDLNLRKGLILFGSAKIRLRLGMRTVRQWARGRETEIIVFRSGWSNRGEIQPLENHLVSPLGRHPSLAAGGSFSATSLFLPSLLSALVAILGPE